MKKIVIIGAGPAGLTCAYKLLKENSNNEIIILESNKKVGGISKTINYQGNRMDLGGHRFFSKNKEVNDIWQEILPVQGKASYDDKILKIDKPLKKSGPDPEIEDKTLLVRNRVSRIYYKRKFFDYPIKMNFETIKKLGFLTTMESGFSYLKSIFFKKEETNLENFYINRFGYKLYNIFFEKYTEKLWGRSPKNISADWGSQRVKGLSILEIIKNSLKKIFHIKEKNVETSLIESFYYPKYGPGQMWEEMATSIKKMGGKIITDAKVKKINKKNNKIINVTYIKNDKEIILNGDIFISSMPIKNLIEITNNIPKKITSIATNLPYRDFMTLGLVVKKLNLQNETSYKTVSNIIPDCWIYIQDSDIKMGRIQVFNNWSPYLVEDLQNTISLGLEYFCDEGDSLWTMSDEKFKDFAISELIKMNIIEKNDVITYHVERVKKAYPAYFDSYAEIDKVVDYLNTISNLYCIGRNGQHRYNNMDHSMLTGIECARNIINSVKNKANIWNVNTEKKYLEEKNND